MKFLAHLALLATVGVGTFALPDWVTNDTLAREAAAEAMRREPVPPMLFQGGMYKGCNGLGDGRIELAEGTRGTEGTEETKGPKGIEGIEETKGMWGTKGTVETTGMEEKKRIEATKGTGTRRRCES